LGLIITFPLSLKAIEGSSLDYLAKGLKKVTYTEVIMESVPPTSKEVLPDGSIIAFGMTIRQQEETFMGMFKTETATSMGTEAVFQSGLKMCVFNSNGVLIRYKWKRGILGGDSKEDSEESPSEAKVKPSGSS